MKALVTYLSVTGNTRKVAEAIYDELRCEKEIEELPEVNAIDTYDVVFLGFPIHAFGPPQPAKDFLKKRCRDKALALFVTHAVSEDFEGLPKWLANCKEPAAKANIRGVFDCQGELGQELLAAALNSSDPKFRKLGEIGAMSTGQPDEARLERARAFAREMTE